jgi:hypothetical protein
MQVWRHRGNWRGKGGRISKGKFLPMSMLTEDRGGGDEGKHSAVWMSERGDYFGENSGRFGREVRRWRREKGVCQTLFFNF